MLSRQSYNTKSIDLTGKFIRLGVRRTELYVFFSCRVTQYAQIKNRGIYLIAKHFTE